MKKYILLILLLPVVVFAAAKIQDADIKTGAAINAAKIADGSVSNTEFQYLDGLASAILGNTLTDAYIFVGNGSNVATGVPLSGDATIANTGALTIANNSISNAKLRDSAALSVMGNATNASTDPADIAAGADHNILRRNGTALAFGSIDLSQSGAVGSSVLAEANGGTGESTFTDGQLLIGNTGGGLTKATLTAGANITITNGNGSIEIASTGGSGTSENVTKDINQVAHGLVVGDVVRFNGTNYVKAQANSAANSQAVGIVSAVADANNFTLTTHGEVTGLSGLTSGALYYLSAATAGLLTSTEPNTASQISKPMLVATSTTTGIFINYRGNAVTSGVIGGPFGLWSFSDNCSWTRANTAYGDYTSDASCTFTQEYNSGMGTVSAISGIQPGITISSAPETGTVKVCATYYGVNSAGDYNGYRMIETAATSVIAKDGGVSSGGSSDGSRICGFFDVTSGNSYSFKMQGNARNGANNIQDGTLQDTWPLAFTVEYK